MAVRKILILILIILIAGFIIYNYLNKKPTKNNSEKLTDNLSQQEDGGGLQNDLHPLSIESLRNGDYPGSEVVIEQTLNPGSNYNRYIASYKSEGLKIYALLTVPNGDPSTHSTYAQGGEQGRTTSSGQGRPESG